MYSRTLYLPGTCSVYLQVRVSYSVRGFTRMPALYSAHTGTNANSTLDYIRTDNCNSILVDSISLVCWVPSGCMCIKVLRSNSLVG